METQFYFLKYPFECFFTKAQNWHYWHYCQLCIQFLLYLHHMMLVNVKLDVSGHKRIRFQCCRLHWYYSFLITQLKQNWQYYHSYIAESL